MSYTRNKFEIYHEYNGFPSENTLALHFEVKQSNHPEKEAQFCFW
jgi:hypothetical protein